MSAEIPTNLPGPGESQGSQEAEPLQVHGSAPTADLIRSFVDVPTLSELVGTIGTLSAEDRSKLKLFSTRLTRAIGKVEKQEAEASLIVMLESARRGPTLDLDNLRNDQLTVPLKKLIRPYKDNIDKFGDEALGHLCLSYQPFRRLLHNGIRTIPQLKRVIKDGLDIPSTLPPADANRISTILL